MFFNTDYTGQKRICIEHFEIESLSDINSLHDNLFLEIFSKLNLLSLSVSCRVSKQWRCLASSPILWKNVIYKELAFGNSKWTNFLGKDVVKDENPDEEFLSLPINIVDEYKKFKIAFPEKNAKKSLKLVRMPKTLNGLITLISVGELAKQYFLHSVDGYECICPEIISKFGNKTIDQSYWFLMTELLPGSRNEINSPPEVIEKSFLRQTEIVASLAKRDLIGYEVPEALEAITCVFAHYFNTKTFLFNDRPWTYTRCKESVEGDNISVGGFSKNGLNVLYHYNGDMDHIGVAAVKRLAFRA